MEVDGTDEAEGPYGRENHGQSETVVGTSQAEQREGGKGGANARRALLSDEEEEGPAYDDKFDAMAEMSVFEARRYSRDASKKKELAEQAKAAAARVSRLGRQAVPSMKVIGNMAA